VTDRQTHRHNKKIVQQLQQTVQNMPYALRIPVMWGRSMPRCGTNQV